MSTTSTPTHAGARAGSLDSERLPTARRDSERLPTARLDGEGLPSGLTLFLGLMVSLAAVIAVTFWLAAHLHSPATRAPGPPEPAAAAVE